MENNKHRSTPFVIMLVLLNNMIPVVGVLFFQWPAVNVLFYFWWETVIFISFLILRILFTGSTQYSFTVRLKRAFFFGFIFYAFVFAHLVFGLIAMVSDTQTASDIQRTSEGFRILTAILLISYGGNFIHHVINDKRDEVNYEVLPFTGIPRIVIQQFTIVLGEFISRSYSFEKTHIWLFLLIGGKLFLDLMTVFFQGKLSFQQKNNK